MDAMLVARPDLAEKIARLVEERGWNQEDFARIANLNRHTVREIIKSVPGRKLRNATISQCAEALGLHVNELRDLPLERLLPRMHGSKLPANQGGRKKLTERATCPDLLAWLDKNPDRAAQITPDEADELLAQQGTTLAQFGIEHSVELLERKRRLMRRVSAVASSEYLDVLEQVVGLMFDKIQPPRS